MLSNAHGSFYIIFSATLLKNMYSASTFLFHVTELLHIMSMILNVVI